MLNVGKAIHCTHELISKLEDLTCEEHAIFLANNKLLIKELWTKFDNVDMADTECLSCDKEFMTSESKTEGDEYTCPFCGHVHVADVDDDDEGNRFWFPSNKRRTQA